MNVRVQKNCTVDVEIDETVDISMKSIRDAINEAVNAAADKDAGLCEFSELLTLCWEILAATENEHLLLLKHQSLRHAEKLLRELADRFGETARQKEVADGLGGPT